MEHHVIIIGGGETFVTKEDYYAHLRSCRYTPEQEARSRSWKAWVADDIQLYATVHTPVMPHKHNADYTAWEIWFNNVVSTIPETATIHCVGYSLGSIFLAKYLSLHPSTYWQSLYLVAPVFDDTGLTESLGNFLFSPDNIQGESIPSVYGYASQDDPIVPRFHVDAYLQPFPQMVIREFTDRGHFWQSSFYELLSDIRSEILK